VVTEKKVKNSFFYVAHFCLEISILIAFSFSKPERFSVGSKTLIKNDADIEDEEGAK
jgi:hypothetical protein